jgi:hypothetical protein
VKFKSEYFCILGMNITISKWCIASTLRRKNLKSQARCWLIHWPPSKRFMTIEAFDLREHNRNWCNCSSVEIDVKLIKTYTVENYQHYPHGNWLLGSEKQLFWEFTCYRSEMLKHSSEKLNFIRKKKRNERQRRIKSKTFRLPFLISQQKRLSIKILSQYRCR